MKITLAEFYAFQKQYPDGWYFEGDESFVDEDFWDGKFDPAKVIDIKENDIMILRDTFFGGNVPNDEMEKDLLTEFKKWKTGIDFEFVTIMIPKDKKAEFMAMVKAKFGVDVK